MPVTNGGTSWTGGQYSIFRVLFGSYLFFHFTALMPWAEEVFEQILPRGASPLLHLFPNILAVADVSLPLIVTAAIAAVAFAIGWHDRIAAVLIWYALACLIGRNPLISNPSLPFAGWLLLAHACLPPAPFWSLAARGRVDPRGGWHMPPSIFAAAWALMSLSYSFSGWSKLGSPSWVDGTAIARVLANPLARPSVLRDIALAMPSPLLQIATWGALGLELLYAPLAFFRRARPWIWVAMLAMHLGLMALIDFADLSFMMVLLHLFTMDPAWIPRRGIGSIDKVLYDGSCGLCHRSVRLLLAEDTGNGFIFAPLGEEDFGVDSIVVKTADGRVLLRSDAVVHLLHRLGGLWRLIGVLLGIVPVALRNAVYDFVARVRYRIFGRTKNACPLMPADLRARFTE